LVWSPGFSRSGAKRKRHDLRVDVSGVDALELVVEDGGDGGNSDWSVWVATQLSR
jgi:hypothetical protein